MVDLYLPPLCTIHPWSPEAMGPQQNAWSNGLSQNLASVAFRPTGAVNYVPFILRIPILVRQMWTYNGTVVSGNVDVGIVSESGVRIVSAGSTPQAGTNVLQVFDVTDTWIGPGRFYLAMTANSATATFFCANTFTVPGIGYFGQLEQQSTFPIPPIATFARPTAGRVYLCGLSTRSLI